MKKKKKIKIMFSIDVNKIPVADIECRVLDIRVFKPGIAVPPLVFVIQYASMTESKSESPSLVSTNKKEKIEKNFFLF